MNSAKGGEWMRGRCRTLLLRVHGCGQGVGIWVYELCRYSLVPRPKVRKCSVILQAITFK